MVPVAGKTVVLPSDMVIPAVNPRENKVAVPNGRLTILEITGSEIKTSKQVEI
jgi:hypothetical protein